MASLRHRPYISLTDDDYALPVGHKELKDMEGRQMPSETTPLMRNLNRSLSGLAHASRDSTSSSDRHGTSVTSLENSISEKDEKNKSKRTLSTFIGVFCPVALSMFSTVLFLRLGFVVGQAGILETVVQFVLAYFILVMTVLSICAISTNGAVEGGGAYYMISRALGPEFGGSIGLLFYLANVFSAALYISGFVEGLVGNFGPGGSVDVPNPLPVSSGTASFAGWSYLYASGCAFLCLIVCLIGGSMFARTSLGILIVVVLCTLTAIVSFFVNGWRAVPIPHSNLQIYKGNDSDNHNLTYFFNYTGMMADTFKENLYSNYTIDYDTKLKMNFASVFAVLFSSVTGIMNGANMSGELKDPSKAIPRGTLQAVCFTFTTYIVMAFLVALSCSRELLLNQYGFMQYINVWPGFVIIGIFAATLSAALGNLIGASRVLEALAKDELFWFVLRPATILSKSGNPYVAVLISWILVQLVLLIGSLNDIAPLVSVFFLLSYAATNLSCLALELASAPNFRPTFKYFTWYTCVLGMVGCLVMCFVINPIFASVAIVVLMVLVILLHLRSVPNSWGSISQALIFHQVRKYLLLLDSRKDHVKYWRPQVLHLVANPRSCVPLIDFMNDLKKGGLYVIGHILVGNFDDSREDEVQKVTPNWLALIDNLKVKAFAELTVAKSVREGLHHLVHLSGLGGMKPNTICMGFYDGSIPNDGLKKKQERNRITRLFASQEEGDDDPISELFPQLRTNGDPARLSSEEYVRMIADTMKLQKNICICRHFDKLNKDEILSNKKKTFIDVWPVNFFRPDTASYLDNTCLFVLQLACILNMVSGWKKKTILRIHLCVDSNADDSDRKKNKLQALLKQLRIIGYIKLIYWDDITKLIGAESDYASDNHYNYECPMVSDDYINGINDMIRKQCDKTAVVFCYLPMVAGQVNRHVRYLQQLDMLTENLPPTVLVHGIHPVTSTTL